MLLFKKIKIDNKYWRFSLDNFLFVFPLVSLLNPEKRVHILFSHIFMFEFLIPPKNYVKYSYQMTVTKSVYYFEMIWKAILAVSFSDSVLAP